MNRNAMIKAMHRSLNLLLMLGLLTGMAYTVRAGSEGNVPADRRGYVSTTETVRKASAEQETSVPELDPEENRPNGQSFCKLKLRGIASSGKATLTWDKCEGAVDYVVFGNKDVKGNMMKKIQTVKSTEFAAEIDDQYCYMYSVKAFNSEGKEIAWAVPVFVAGSKSPYHNPTGVEIVGGRKSFRLFPRAAVITKGRVTGTGNLYTRRGIRYESSDPSVADVHPEVGVILAKEAGSCTIYVYAQNGTYERVSVRVMKRVKPKLRPSERHLKNIRSRPTRW